MNDQMTFTTEEGEKIILAEEVEKKEKAAAEYLKARNRARAAIKDAKLRYIKEKTRARSKKAAEEAEKPGTLVVMLLPARTDTRWFHDYIYHRAAVRFIRDRLKFGGCSNAAPFPSMVVIFQKEE